MTLIRVTACTDVDKTVVSHSGSGCDICDYALYSAGYGLPARYRLHFLPLKTLHVINYDERNMNLCSHTSLKGFRSVALEMPKRHTQAQTDSQTGACKRTTPLPT